MPPLRTYRVTLTEKMRTMGITTTNSLEKERFIPLNLSINCWADLAPYYQELLERPLHTSRHLYQWLRHRSQLDAFTSELMAWRYIRLSRDNRDEEALEQYQRFVQEIQPRVTELNYQLNVKLVRHPLIHLLEQGPYRIYLRSVRNEVALYADDNVDVRTQIKLRSKEYDRIFASMTVGIEGAQLTLQQANALLDNPDTSQRERVYRKISTRIQQDSEELERLFDDLLSKRHCMALNAGFENYRDYRFRSLGRFDYTVEDCLEFHESIKAEIIPLLNQMNLLRADALDIDQLRPWDMHVDPSGRPPKVPYQNIPDLIDRTVTCLNNLHPLFGKVLRKMQSEQHLDLESRPGKRPGGYNMPLMMTGLPFIFMNASQSIGDVRTLIHESGHAIHAYLVRHLEPAAARRVPSEIAELAAMSTEILSMDHWDAFFENKADLNRARLQQLELVLKVLPSIATIDKFQHWLYTHPGHNQEERRAAWLQIFGEFKSDIVDHTGLEDITACLWHKQLHLFEVPFYYIEYGMAQLGAIALWKQYREDPETTIERFINAMRLGYSKSIGEVYQAAGIDFKFSAEYVAQLGTFVKQEIDALTKAV